MGDDAGDDARVWTWSPEDEREDRWKTIDPLIARGDRAGAIRAFRAGTGAPMREARRLVGERAEELGRRAPPA